MNSQDIINWYEGIDESRMDADGNIVDLDRLLFMRKQLSVQAVKLANWTAKKQKEYKTLYAQRKVQQAIHELNGEGTVADRKNEAIRLLEREIETEGRLEGEIMAGKIKLDQWNKVLDSMAGYIGAMKGI